MSLVIVCQYYLGAEARRKDHSLALGAALFSVQEFALYAKNIPVVALAILPSN
jgi:hypothetical protein